jgi:hypothetical protein
LWVMGSLRPLEEHDLARAAQLAEINQELGRRLDLLDHARLAAPAEARARLLRKSEARRKSDLSNLPGPGSNRFRDF